MPTILIADDDRSIRTVLARALEKQGYAVMSAEEGGQLLQWVRDGLGDAVITDVVMPMPRESETGLDLLPLIREERPEMPVIVISAQSTLMTAVKAAEGGAFEYLPKPFDLDELLACVGKACHAPEVMLPDKSEARLSHPSIIGASAAMQKIYRTLARVVATDLTVMIHGESGTGKELVARAIHDLGPRKLRPFIAVNMAAIPRELIESELFGHEKGAFTGALARKAGTFERAAGGTVFLDEIGDMPLEAQTRLLRVLQSNEFTPVGGASPQKTDVRVLCATHRSLKGQVEQGAFREDLFYRLNVVPMQVPPLRERREDISVLAEHFLAKAVARGLPRKHFGREAESALMEYRWPGNVRELENTVYRLCALVPESLIGAEAVMQALSSGGVTQEEEEKGASSLEYVIARHIQRYFAAHEGSLPPPGIYDRILPLLERPLLMETLRQTGGNQIRAAYLLGINRNTLRKRLRELSLSADIKEEA